MAKFWWKLLCHFKLKGPGEHRTLLLKALKFYVIFQLLHEIKELMRSWKKILC